MFTKYPYVPQIDMRGCVVSALFSVIQHYGSYYSLAHLRQLAHINIEGIGNVSEKKIFEACQNATILSNILKLPQQFNTEIGIDATLSGGQKQRLTLLYSNTARL